MQVYILLFLFLIVQVTLTTDTYIHGRANQNHAKNLEADLANLEYLKNDLKNSTFFFARIQMCMSFIDPNQFFWCPSSGPPWAALFVTRSLSTKSDHEIETWCWYHLIGLFNTKKSSLGPKSDILQFSRYGPFHYNK